MIKCKYGEYSTEPVKGCVACKGIKVTCTHPSRNGFASNSKRCNKKHCKFFEEKE
jgi:hypothetical protein